MTPGKGKRRPQNPCDGCGLHRDLCICEFIPSIACRTRLSLIIHTKELKRTTNTGRLAVKSLKNSELVIRGRIDAPVDLTTLMSDKYRTVLFYPSDDAVELNRAFVDASDRPIHLLVPDGNWRQASKVHYRHSEIRNVPRVMIKTPNTDRGRLRAESSDVGMATLQAIAAAFGVIEGAEVGDALMRVYRLKLERTLASRGTGPLDF